MATKLGKNEYPQGTTANDFKCYGPPAEKDTEFDNAKIVDMGCFTQDGKDSNKYYHASMCTANGSWYVYVEYGRQGAGKPQFQFISCTSEAEAQKEFTKKCAEKNTKRGRWDTVGGIKMFVPKSGKDMYSVRVLAKRTHGLPDSQTISAPEVAKRTTVKKSSKKSFRCDPQTTALMSDLVGGTVKYTRASLQGGTIPVQSAIDEARDMLMSAKRRLVDVGNDLDDQINDSQLKQLTYSLYSRIPKIKKLHSHESDWLLNQGNIGSWEQDLDAFETALQTGTVTASGEDPMHGMPLDMEWVDPKSKVGLWMNDWWPKATRNKHGNVGSMKIKNLWSIARHGDDTVFNKEMKKVNKTIGAIAERPLHQDKKRQDLTTAERKLYWDTNVAMLFHGTRSVNVAGILRTNLKLPAELSGVVITGAMFGDGLYWADDWKKSANYTSMGMYSKSNNGAVKGRSAFMFVADVVLGQPFVAPWSHGYTTPPKGHDCIFGKNGVSKSTWNHKALLNNEWIVYKGGRNVLKYLAEFTF